MRSTGQWLADIADGCNDAARLVERGRAAFDADVLLQRAGKNIVIEIGEAAKQVPDEALAFLDYPYWRQLKAMRDRVVHACPVVDLDILWDVLAHHCPRISVAIATATAGAEERHDHAPEEQPP